MVGSSVIVGRVHIKDESEGKEYESDEIIQHERFDPKTLENDIALLHIPNDIQFNDNVASVDLPSDCENYVGHTCNISGYGHMGKDKPLATTLQYTELEIVDDKRCNRLYNHENFDGTKLCALGKDGRSTCSGDSGGPCVNTTLIGIVSFGKGSCDGCNPSGHTKVCTFVPWIAEKTGMD